MVQSFRRLLKSGLDQRGEYQVPSGPLQYLVDGLRLWQFLSWFLYVNWIGVSGQIG